MAREMFNKLIEYIGMNKGKVFGGFIGFLIAILILTIGFFKTLFILFWTWLGYFLGSSSDSRKYIRELLDKILSPSKKDWKYNNIGRNNQGG